MRRLFKWASARIVAAIAFALPLAAMASVDYTGTDYEPWSYSAGCVVWRATSGQLFHASTVADVAADGTVGAEYDLNTSGHPWNVFASTVNGQANANYTSPGLTLVFDVAGYNNNSDAQFAPLSFGGMWVKVLQAEDTPYTITDNKSDGSNRQVELGATGASTYFKFDESFTFNRNTATAVKGTATVEIANGKTFTINARANKGAVVESGNTLVLKGEGTLAVTGGMTVDGTLDLTATTLPTIDGDVALNGTILLPAGTTLPYTVCSGTLSGLNVTVKIGDDEAVEKSMTISGGAITALDDPIYIFYDNYPTVVPAGKTYTFVGGDSAENTVVVDALDVRGTLKTQGYFSFTNYKSGGAAAVLDVETGSLTLSPGNNWFNGTLTVEAGATFVNTLTDAVQYGGSFTANIYGTLTMGSTRWSLGSNNTLNFYEGCTVTGSGDGNNGTFDWIENATGTLNVYGEVNLAAPIKIRSTATVNVNVDAGANAGLTLAGTIGAGKIVKQGAGLVKFTTNPPYAITVANGAFTFAVDATPTITYSAKPGTGTSMSMWYATQSTWKGTVVIGVLSAPANIPLSSYGNENSKIVLKGTTGSSYLSSGTIASELVIDTADGDTVEFNNGSSGQVVTFTKVSGSGALKLVGWTGCSSATYNFTTLDNFTGLAVENAITRNGGGTFTIGIGNIVTSNSTAYGACVLPIVNTAVNGATGTVAYNLDNATLNGSAADLVVGTNGIYVPSATITYADSTTEYKYGQLATILQNLYMSYTSAKAGAVVTVLDGSDATFGDGLPQIYDYDSAAHTYTLKPMVVAIQVGAMTYYAPDASFVLQAAMQSDVTATLLVDLDMSTWGEGMTIPGSMDAGGGQKVDLHDITLNLGGKTITGPADGYVIVNAGADITITGEGTVEGAGIVSNATSTATTTISGGTYTATGDDLFAAEEGSTITVSGGTYNKTVDDEYVASGYKVTGSGETYTVEAYWIYEAVNAKELTGAWSNEVTYAEGKVRIEDGNTYTAAAPSAGQMVTLDLTLSFDGINEDDVAVNDAKAAVRLGAGANENEYVFQLYTYDNDGGTSLWVNVEAEGVTATTDTDYKFTFVLDMTNKTYTAKVNNVSLGSRAAYDFACGSAGSDSVQSIEFTGAGTVTSILGDYEDAEEPEVFVENDEVALSNGSATLSQAQATWLNQFGAKAAVAAKLATLTSAQFSAAYLLNLDVMGDNFAYDFAVTDIDIGAADIVVTVQLLRPGAVKENATALPINGTLKLMGGNALPASLFQEVQSVTFSDADFSDGNTTTCTFGKGDDPAEFYQPVIE